MLTVSQNYILKNNLVMYAKFLTVKEICWVWGFGFFFFEMYVQAVSTMVGYK